MKAHVRPRRDAGFSLLEVMLAMALFTTAAVVLVETINEIGNITLQARNLRSVEQTMESLLDEYSKMPQIQEKEVEPKLGLGDNVKFKITIKAVDDLKDQDNNILSGIFRIRVIASWQEEGKPMTMETETLRYSGMFLPQ